MRYIFRRYRQEWKRVFTTVFIIGLVFIIFRELKSLDFYTYGKLVERMPRLTQISTIVFGLLAFSFSMGYDFFLLSGREEKVDFFNKLKVAWISQAFNNFVGVGGVTGAGIRMKLLKGLGVSDEERIEYSATIILSQLTGIFALSIPAAIIVSQQGIKWVWLLTLTSAYLIIYFLGEKTPLFSKLPSVLKRFFEVDVMSLKNRVKYFSISLLDWVVVGTYFSFLIHIFTPEANPIHTMGIYIIATLLGLMTFLPGGIGSFDLAVILLFSSLGYASEGVLVSIMIYRISYYFIPWGISIVLLIHTQIKSFGNIKHGKELFRRIIVPILAISILLCGIILLWSSATPSIFREQRFLSHIIPNPLREVSRGVMAAIGLLLILLSRGISQRIRGAYSFSFILLFVAIFTSLLQGFYIEIAIIMGVFALFLWLSREEFTVESINLGEGTFSKNVYISILLVIFYFALYNISHKVHFFEDTQKFSLYWIQNHPWSMLIILLFILLFSMLFVFVKKKTLEFHKVMDVEVEELESFLEQYTANPYTHLFYLRDKNSFYNEKHTVFFQYRPVGDNLLVLGDPIGEEEDFEDAIDELIQFAQSNGMVVSFYQVQGRNLELYADQGFRFVKLGEDANLDLESFTYSGNRNKNLRRVHNNIENKGYSFEMVSPPFTENFYNTLQDISTEWLGKRQELGFSLGNFGEEYVNRAPVGVLKNPEQEIVAFATLLPIKGSKTISIDLMRFKKDLPEGNEMDMLFLCLFDWAKEEGYSIFNIGMAPLSNVGTGHYSGTKEKLLQLVFDYGNTFYSFKGLQAYKEKFHPYWESRYLIYREDGKLPDLLFSLVEASHESTEKK